jgi:UDP-N-acetyl-2-amino-2-deoxyglucuronate dehydrogenase
MRRRRLAAGSLLVIWRRQDGTMALRFGIIGCGGIAGIHAQALARLEEQGLAKLVAGADAFEQSRCRFAEKWKVPVAATIEQMLERADVDAVMIASPSGLHGEQVIAAARAGKHILCEKPLDTRIEKAEAALAAARENKVILGGIFQQRFLPTPLKVKRAIDAGLFGQIVMVHCETPWYRSNEYYAQASWRGTWELDGGVLSNQSPHMIDRMLWLAGDVEEVISATCKEGYLRKIEAETLAVATVRLMNGALGTITGTTLAYEGLPQRLLVCGTDGSAAFCGDELVYFKTRQPFDDEGEQESLSTDAPGGNRSVDPLAINIEPHVRNIRDFVEAVRDGRTPMVSDEDSIRVVRLLNEIYRKARVGPYAH